MEHALTLVLIVVRENLVLPGHLELGAVVEVHQRGLDGLESGGVGDDVGVGRRVVASACDGHGIDEVGAGGGGEERAEVRAGGGEGEEGEETVAGVLLVLIGSGDEGRGRVRVGLALGSVVESRGGVEHHLLGVVCPPRDLLLPALDLLAGLGYARVRAVSVREDLVGARVDVDVEVTVRDGLAVDDLEEVRVEDAIVLGRVPVDELELGRRVERLDERDGRVSPDTTGDVDCAAALLAERLDLRGRVERGESAGGVAERVLGRGRVEPPVERLAD